MIFERFHFRLVLEGCAIRKVYFFPENCSVVKEKTNSMITTSSSNQSLPKNDLPPFNRFCYIDPVSQLEGFSTLVQLEKREIINHVLVINPLLTKLVWSRHWILALFYLFVSDLIDLDLDLDLVSVRKDTKKNNTSPR